MRSESWVRASAAAVRPVCRAVLVARWPCSRVAIRSSSAAGTVVLVVEGSRGGGPFAHALAGRVVPGVGHAVGCCWGRKLAAVARGVLLVVEVEAGAAAAWALRVVLLRFWDCLAGPIMGSKSREMCSG